MRAIVTDFEAVVEETGFNPDTQKTEFLPNTISTIHVHQIEEILPWVAGALVGEM
jgi:hypothetical protein